MKSVHLFYPRAGTDTRWRSLLPVNAMPIRQPARNNPIYVPLDVVFLRDGDTWTVERL